MSTAVGAGPADDRFEQLNGPLAGFVVRPADFAMDPSRVLVDPAPLLARVDRTRAMTLVEDLSFPRTANGPEADRQRARNLVSEALTDAGYEPQQESVTYAATGIDSPNVFADLAGTECPSKMIVIGGHYDSATPGGPGADDNATGVAGMIEIARALRDRPLPVTVRFAAWSYEEVGLVGAGVMADGLKSSGTDVLGAISLEMIGFTKPGTDPLTGLGNDYLALVADPTSASLARTFGAAAYRYTPEFAAMGAVIDPAVLGDILRSDHAAFLARGFPALMATDTANFRNPNYHEVTDAPASLDPVFLENSTRAVLAGLVTFASSDQDGDGRSDLCHAPTTSTSTSTSTTPSSTTPTTQTAGEGAGPSGGVGTPPAAPAAATHGRPSYVG